MRKLIIVASAFAITSAMPAFAEKGGKGEGKGGGQAQSHGGKGGKHGEQGGKSDHGQRGKVAKASKPERDSRAGSNGMQSRSQGYAKAEGKAERKDFRRGERSLGQRFDDRDGRRGDDYQQRRFDERNGSAYAGLQGCPPGLAKKNNGCLPPGQAKRDLSVGQRIQPAWFSGYALPAAYNDFYYDSDEYYYRYNDEGYIYRVDSGSNMITALIPLLGGGFSVGQALPQGFGAYNLPTQYRDNYYDTNEDYYRYGDNAIYRVNAGSGVIESVVALLAGNMNVGQALPSGYDAYNLPMEYRDDYADTDEDMYRYADGNIYQVDTKTQIIQAIVKMLV